MTNLYSHYIKTILNTQKCYESVIMCVLFVAEMDSSDDEPLIKKTTTSSAAQKIASNGDKTDCKENKTTGDDFIQLFRVV